jgi:hypothetical protein
MFRWHATAAGKAQGHSRQKEGAQDDPSGKTSFGVLVSFAVKSFEVDQPGLSAHGAKMHLASNPLVVTNLVLSIPFMVFSRRIHRPAKPPR